MHEIFFPLMFAGLLIYFYFIFRLIQLLKRNHLEWMKRNHMESVIQYGIFNRNWSLFRFIYSKGDLSDVGIGKVKKIIWSVTGVLIILSWSGFFLVFKNISR